VSNRADELLNGAAVVLVKPRLPENIGATARVVSNMGLGRLILVRPERWDLERMLALAVRLGRPIILDEVRLTTSLAEAVSGFQFVVGASARLGRFRRPTGWPREVMEEAAGLLPANRVALVFGPEKDGLTNEELGLCHRLVQIPTSPRASSLNLAQAVAVLAYELRMAALMGQARPASAPDLASSLEIQGLLGHLRATMDLVDPGEHLNRRVWLDAFRRFFARARLLPHEVRLFRGVLRKIAYAVGRPGSGRGPVRDDSAGGMGYDARSQEDSPAALGGQR